MPSIDPTTNRFANAAMYQFDAVGNLIRDAHGRQFVFNGENKQVQVQDAQNNVVGEYRYDGNGRRIKKISASETVLFVYDGLGKLIGEYSTAGPPANPMVHYTATDPLGSPRVLTNERGEIVSRRDFMPFGEEIAPDATYRTAAHKYGVEDGVRQKFTGYERDAETDLDFAQARYYNNRHGRFTAVDPLLASGLSANPQTFNRYAYTMNRPLILTDPTGLQSGKPASPEKSKPSTPIKQTPPTASEVELTGTAGPPSREGYVLQISGYTPVAINDGIVTDGLGNTIQPQALGLDPKKNKYGFGIVVSYQLVVTEGFPAPDKDANTTLTETISESTLDGQPSSNTEGVGDKTKPAQGKVNSNGNIEFTDADFIGITSVTPDGPQQVSKSKQALELTTKVQGQTFTEILRTNIIEINPKPKDGIKIRITEVTDSEDN